MMLLLISFIFTVTFAGNYKLQDTYMGNTFFDGFRFDMQHNGVFDQFVDEQTARSKGMINTTATTAYIGTDYTNKCSSSGRPAIQIESYKLYDQGLFILDASHMPQGCGTWPAFWLTNQSHWPTWGEIDIIEGIDLWTDDASTIHSTSSCTFAGHQSKNITGKWNGDMSIWANNNQSFGIPFNEAGGGVYATEVNDNIGIRIWFWLHKDVPSDIKSKTPNPDAWGLPYAFFPFGSWCTSDHFKQMAILFDLYYCGWAGQSNTFGSMCNSIANGASCEDFVMNNPSYFRDAYWLINYVETYQLTAYKIISNI
eukprot:87070_1